MCSVQFKVCADHNHGKTYIEYWLSEWYLSNYSSCCKCYYWFWLSYYTTSLHWLCIPQRIEYKIAMLTYEALYESAPRYLSPLVPVADLPGSLALHFAGINRLSVPSVRLSTVGSRVFPVAGPRIWNALPQEMSAKLLSLFRQRLKSYLFRQSYPDLDIWCVVLSHCCFVNSLTLK